MWLILQPDKPKHYVLATGIMTTKRVFCPNAFGAIEIELHFEGEGEQEIGINVATGNTVINVDLR